MRVKTLLSTLLGVVVVVFGYLSLSTNEERILDVHSTSKSFKHSTTLYKFDEDIGSVYRLKFTQNSSLLMSKMLPGKLEYGFVVEALLNMRVLQKNKNSIFLAYQLSKFSLGGQGVTKAMIEKLQPYYSSMFLVKIDKYGKILKLYFPGKYSNFAGLAQMSYLLEVLNKRAKNYKEREDDAIGTYEAFYQKNNLIIKKQKTKYLKVKTPDERYKVQIKEFKLQAMIDTKANWLQSLNLSESLLIRDEKSLPYATNKNTVVFEKIDEDIDTTLDIYKETRDIDTILKAFKKLQKEDIDIFEALANERDRDAFKRDNIELDTLIAKLLKEQNEDKNLRMIKKYIQLFPQTTYKLEGPILQVNDTTSMRLIAILSLVSTPEAQELLGKLATNDTTSHMTNIRAIIALGGVEEQTSQTKALLINISDTRDSSSAIDNSNTALLALSTTTSKEQDNSEVLSYVKSQYYSADTLDREKNALYSMQNAGAENFLDEIQTALTSPSNKVREIAISTLATIEDEDLRETLLKEQLQVQQDKKLKEYIMILLKKK